MQQVAAVLLSFAGIQLYVKTSVSFAEMPSVSALNEAVQVCWQIPLLHIQLKEGVRGRFPSIFHAMTSARSPRISKTVALILSPSAT